MLGPETCDSNFKMTLDNLLAEMDTHFYKREDIRANIVAGEISASASDHLAKLAQSDMGTDTAKIMTEVPASEVMARGAAVLARQTQMTPWRFIGDNCHEGYSHEADGLQGRDVTRTIIESGKDICLLDISL